MSKKLHHSLERVKERVGIGSTSDAKRFITSARKYGLGKECFEKLPDFWAFLDKKEKALGKIMKVYKGYVVVCNRTNRTGTGATTVYEIPSDFVEEVESLVGELDNLDVRAIDRWDLIEKKQYTVYVYFNIWGQIRITVPVVIESGTKIELGEIKRLFKQNMVRQDGVYYTVKPNGYIEKDYKPVGTWHIGT